MNGSNIETEYYILTIVEDRYLGLTRYFSIRNNQGIRDHTLLAHGHGYFEHGDSWNAEVEQVDVSGNQLIKVLYGKD